MSKNHFCVGGGHSEVFTFVTAIYRIAIREADVSDGGLPEVHHFGLVRQILAADVSSR